MHVHAPTVSREGRVAIRGFRSSLEDLRKRQLAKDYTIPGPLNPKPGMSKLRGKARLARLKEE